MDPIIFLDLDGVCANFVDSAIVANKLEFSHDDVTEYGFWSLAGISSNQFWKAIDSHPNFWEGMASYPWFERLKEMVGQYEFHVCTSPSKSPSCFSGKATWIADNFGSQFRDFFLTPQKHLLAGPNRILIDDSDDKIQRFRNHGGHGILFPQPWNENRRSVDYRLEFVETELEVMIEVIQGANG